MKCTNEKWKLKEILSCRFEKEKVKRSSDKFAMDEFITIFFSRLVSAEEKPNKQRFKVQFVCCYRRESLF